MPILNKLKIFIQPSLLLVSLLIVFSFLHFYQIETANTLKEDFLRQNYVEMSRGETHLITKKLASFAKSPLVRCIVGYRSGLVFFEEKKSNCDAGFLLQKVLVEEKNNKYLIEIYVQLPQSLSKGFLAFFLFQLCVYIIFLKREKSDLFKSLEKDINYAAFAKQVAHDIQSPFAVLKKENLSSKARIVVQRVEQILEDIQPSKKKFQAFISLESLVKEITEEVLLEHKPKDVNISLDLSDEAIIEPMVDPINWRRIISNLLNNAVEAHDSNQVKIVIIASVNEGFVELRIRDFGKGISLENAKKAGKRIFSHGKEKGRGIGLFSACRFLEKLGGTLEILPHVESGSVVNIRFPRFASQGVVLIDDDKELLHLWEKSSRKITEYFWGFSDINAFFERYNGGQGAEIFLDIHLFGQRIDYQSIVTNLKRKGFNRIFLATGEAVPKDSTENILAVVGKEPPWV